MDEGKRISPASRVELAVKESPRKGKTNKFIIIILTYREWKQYVAEQYFSSSPLTVPAKPTLINANKL